MRPVERSELLGLGSYEEIREPFRRRIIELKRGRRVSLGSNMSVLFENHDTVLFQVQEMLRTERITAESAILHELETYNQLVPARGELSATIFIEYPDRDERERMLVALAGVERCFYVSIDGERSMNAEHGRGDRSDRTTAVHYVKFPLADAALARLATRRCSVSVGVDHPAYQAEARLSAELVASLAEEATS